MSNKFNKKTVVFLDRDGVINKLKNPTVKSPEEFEFIFGSPYAIKALNDAGILTVVVTNQGGVERGELTEKELGRVHQYMWEQLKTFNAYIDHLYYCKYLDSYSRKPEPGMIETAIEDLKLQNYRKYMIGDKVSDIQAGNSCSCTSILVKTGHGKKQAIPYIGKDKDGEDTYVREIKSILQTPQHITENLKSAVKWILNGEKDY
jgi:D-glycero-D-manno-heptose 1,7-bisphosphate phosphatase